MWYCTENMEPACASKGVAEMLKLITHSDFDSVFSSAAIISINKTILVLSVRSNTLYFLDGSQYSSPGQLCEVSCRSIPSKFLKGNVSREETCSFLEKMNTSRSN